MAKNIVIKNEASGMMKTGVYGFSWTYLFFGTGICILADMPVKNFSTSFWI